jgi:hypothetical protein
MMMKYKKEKSWSVFGQHFTTDQEHIRKQVKPAVVV